ncbi:MAG: HAMP domain-containing sensor histidine kinase, partial [Thermoproteota archaeon]
KMQVMYENSIRLTTLIQDILDARKIEMKRLNLDIQVESIKEIAKRCIDIFRPIAESKGIRLVDETQDIAIKCDPDRILQVLNNVVSNAMKFVPAQDGTILINSRNDKDTVMISIKDNGVGIPKSKQEDLFKKFYQVDKSLTRKSGGTGLGLAISRGIIEAHGGKIWVESEENQGTTVHFTIQNGDGK